MIQILDENQTFSPTLPTYIASWNKPSRGLDYHVIAVFGSQSTGKSTLLNALFSTQFATMSGTRQQTTKGIWMVASESMLVMDVEGTDGRERGQDQDFERKSALFSLSVASENMVGLYNGANMGLLRTVFQVYLELFSGKSQKTLLMFVIRDFTGSTPLQSLSGTLLADITGLWGEYTKAPLSDYFDVSFTALPHRVYARGEFLCNVDMFDAAVATLKTRFTSSDILQEKYKKQIPADGFPSYAQAVWERISENKALDIPTQQTLLAQFRIEEISTTVLSSVEERVKVLRRDLQHLNGLLFKEVHETALKAFKADASRYMQSVYTQKLSEFITRLRAVLSALFTAWARHVSLTLSKSMAQQIKDTPVDDSYATTLDSLVLTAIEDYNHKLADCSVFGWEFDAQDLTLALEDVVARCKESALEKRLTQLRKTVHNKLLEAVQLAFLASSFSDALSNSIDTIATDATDTATLLAKSITGSTASTDMLEFCTETLTQHLKTTLTPARVSDHLMQLFDSHFSYSNGLPRVWTPTDDIDGIYASASETALKALSSFHSTSRLDLLNTAAIHDTRILFKKQAAAAYLAAKTPSVPVPQWLLVLLAVLGFNEAWAILTSPILFFSVVAFGAVAAWLYSTGMYVPVVGLLRGIVDDLVLQVVRGVQDRRDLKERDLKKESEKKD